MPCQLLAVAIALLTLVSVPLRSSGSEPPALDSADVDFNRDIQPLLSENCFKCHGPDESVREGGLRLDTEDGAFAELDSGAHGIVANNLEKSELFRRITATDPDEQMPPPDSGKSLSKDDIAIIKSWIEQGANWSGHWSFQAPRRQVIPGRIDDWRVNNPIDRFVHARLVGLGLAPAELASKETLIRRLTLDLTGLPPTVHEVDRFLADQAADAYERLVDRLLNSNRYGEHMGRIWLDAARYADTHGLHLDNERSMYPYREWVINAFNANMPFDQFTIEQLAGDLLPEPSLDQRVATGFNRCNVTTSEGGSIDAEYYVRYAVDRVETTSTVWMGLTSGCAACHDHKFDPITQKEFYQLFSYFYSLTEKAMDGNALLPPPVVKVPTRLQLLEKTRLEAELADAKSNVSQTLEQLAYVDPTPNPPELKLVKTDAIWFDDDVPEGASKKGDGDDPWRLVSAPEHPVLSGKHASVRTGEGLTQHYFEKAKHPLKVTPSDQLFAYVYLDPKNPPETIQLQFNDGSWEHRAYWGADKAHGAGKKGPANFHMGDLPEAGKWIRLDVNAGDVGLKDGAKLNGWAFTQFGGTVYWDKAGKVGISLADEQKTSLAQWEQFRAKVKHPALPGDVQAAIEIAPDKREDAHRETLTRYFLQHVNPKTMQQLAGPRKQESDIQKRIDELNKQIPSTLVMEDRKERRQAHVLERGEYTKPQEKVDSRIPEWIAPPVKDAPANRLGLAKWLVHPQHPLTARVTVNRIWQHYFGTGLVKTSEDFGVQGERPSHPKLLDWLALDFIDSGWNVKRFHKQIVMSATYRQSSRVTPEKLAADPENRFCSRGPRFRMDAEVIRDQALAISGLMVPAIGGKSVKPYQPEGLWAPVGFGGSNTAKFKQDSGSNLYRRSMYTFWKRTSPPPSMSTFDAPDRETCQVRRARTNTPLQALVLLNDVQFMEAARKFAERVMSEGGPSDDEKLTYAFRSVTARKPSDSERASLRSLYDEYLAEFLQQPEEAAKLLSVGESKRDESMSVHELSAWTMITHLLLNLNEAVTKG